MKVRQLAARLAKLDPEKEILVLPMDGKYVEDIESVHPVFLLGDGKYEYKGGLYKKAQDLIDDGYDVEDVSEGYMLTC